MVSSYIERIKEIQPILNCVVKDRFEEALKDARKCDELLKSQDAPSVEYLEKEKPLFGVPFTTKVILHSYYNLILISLDFIGDDKFDITNVLLLFLVCRQNCTTVNLSVYLCTRIKLRRNMILMIVSQDCIAVANMCQTAGLVTRKNITADKDAKAIELMRSAGAIPLALTNISELAMWWESSNCLFGTSKNPYNTRYSMLHHHTVMRYIVLRYASNKETYYLSRICNY